MHQAFSIEESLKFGWQKLKEHSMLLFQVLLTLFVFEVVYGITTDALEGPALFVVASILMVVGFVLGTGFTIITLKIGKGEHATYRDLLPKPMVVWKFFLISTLVGLIVLGGLILLIIPGIYFAIRFSMARFAVLEGTPIMESLKKSTTLTEGIKWQLLLFFVVIIALNILGAIPFGLGLLITLPVTAIAFVHVYEKLKHRHGHHTESHEAHTPA
jgi:uncharacterized membrane protein